MATPISSEAKKCRSRKVLVGSARLGSDPKVLADSKSACVVPTTWRPRRRLKSWALRVIRTDSSATRRRDDGDLAFEGLPLESLEALDAEEEAAWLLVPALLAGVAATGAMGVIMAWCRSCTYCTQIRRQSDTFCVKDQIRWLPLHYDLLLWCPSAQPSPT
eukprot:s3053_g3.t1